MYETYKTLMVGSRRVAMFEDGSLVPIIEGGIDGPAAEGGPGSDGEPDSQGAGEGGDDLVSVTLAGVETKVTPELKKLLDERELEFNRKLSSQGEELGQLRTQVNDIHTQTVASDEGEGEGELSDAELGAQMFTDPRGVFKYLMNEAAPELKSAILQEAGVELDKRESRSQFWSSFYSANKDLAKHKDIVDLVANQEYPKIKSLSTEEGAKHIAAKTREQIVRIVSDFTPEGTVVKKEGFVEGASSTKAPVKKTIEEEFSLSSLIKSRNAKRRASGAKVMEK